MVVVALLLIKASGIGAIGVVLPVGYLPFRG
jgi:hypothetical protein